MNDHAADQWKSRALTAEGEARRLRAFADSLRADLNAAEVTNARLREKLAHLGYTELEVTAFASGERNAYAELQRRFGPPRAVQL